MISEFLRLILSISAVVVSAFSCGFCYSTYLNMKRRYAEPIVLESSMTDEEAEKLAAIIKEVSLNDRIR